MGIAPSTGRKDDSTLNRTLSSPTIAQLVPIGPDGDPMLVEHDYLCRLKHRPE
jgi:hypothetical protein